MRRPCFIGHHVAAGGSSVIQDVEVAADEEGRPRYLYSNAVRRSYVLGHNSLMPMGVRAPPHYYYYYYYYYYFSVLYSQLVKWCVQCCPTFLCTRAQFTDAYGGAAPPHYYYYHHHHHNHHLIRTTPPPTTTTNNNNNNVKTLNICSFCPSM
jgi:hypothetical protein